MFTVECVFEAVFSIIQIGTDSALVAYLATIMTNCDFLFHHRQIESRTEKIMNIFFINWDILLSMLAFRSLGTKSNQPIRAHYFPYMPSKIYLWSFVRYIASTNIAIAGAPFTTSLRILNSHCKEGARDVNVSH